MSDGELPGWLLFRVLSGPSRDSDGAHGFQSGWTRAGIQPPSPDAAMRFIFSHVTEWGNYGCSPFLSTTTNFLWAMWEAGRRQVLWETESADWQFRPQILVIDSRCLPAENVLRITESPYVLPKGECRNFAKSSSEVLVKDRIPNDAVLAQIEWSDICDHLPPFFDLKVTFVDFYGNAGTYGSYNDRRSDCRSKFTEQAPEEVALDLVRFLYDDINLRLDIVLMLALHIVFVLKPSAPQTVTEYANSLGEELFVMIHAEGHDVWEMFEDYRDYQGNAQFGLHCKVIVDKLDDDWFTAQMQELGI